MLLGYKDLPAEIRKQITEVTDIWKKHMGKKLAGVYLHGSICLNAFEPGSCEFEPDKLQELRDHLVEEIRR